MKLKIRKNSRMGLATLKDVWKFFDETFFNGFDDLMDGEEFIEMFKEHLEFYKFPCDMIILNPFYSHHDFSITLYLKEVQVGFISITKNKRTRTYGIRTMYEGINNTAIQNFLNSIIYEFFDKRNLELFEDALSECDVKKTEDGKYEVEIVYCYNDHQTENVKVLKGSWDEIFDEFTNINETYKYCNSMYYTFKNSDIKRLYNIYICSYMRNYFLMNAVKHDRLID